MPSPRSPRATLAALAIAACASSACEPRRARSRAGADGKGVAASPVAKASPSPTEGAGGPEGAAAPIVVALDVKNGKAQPPAAKGSARATGETDLEREAREEASGASATTTTLALGSTIPKASNVPWPEVPPARTDALGSAFRPVQAKPEELLELAKGAPELRRFGPDFALFAKDDVGRVTNVNGQAFQRLTFTVEPLLWQPKQGVLLMLVPYRGTKGSVLAAFWELEGGGHRLASAFALAEEPVPMALVYESHKREELHWSACWNCPGGQGEVLLKEDGRVVIAQR